MNPPTELLLLKNEFGLDPLVVSRELAVLNGSGTLENAASARQTFRVLTKLLNEGGLLSERTKAFYANFIAEDVDGDCDVSEDIVAGGIAYLSERQVEHRFRNT